MLFASPAGHSSEPAGHFSGLAGSGEASAGRFTRPAGSGELFAGDHARAGAVPCPASKIFRTASIVSASAAVLSSR
jgi:hypothetical protein